MVNYVLFFMNNNYGILLIKIWSINDGDAGNERSRKKTNTAPR